MLRVNRATVAAGLAVAILLAFANSFQAGFYFDDLYGIVNNPAIKSLRNIPNLFIDPHAYWTDHTQPDMRPVLMLSYAINYAISGLEPWSYHALNLLIHFAAAFLVFVLVRDHVWPDDDASPVPKTVLAASAALIFAIAPLNNQPVVYIWARSALLCTALYLAGFLFYLRGARIAGGLFHLLAMLTKAIAVTLPVLLAVHALLYRDRKRYPTIVAWLRDWRPLARLLALPAVLNICYLAYRWAILPSGAHGGRHEAWVTPLTWFMSQWSALLYYVKLFVWPSGLSVDHDFPYATSILQFRAWGALLVILAWLFAALRLERRAPHVTFATLWFFLTLAPESTFAPLGEVINDHRPYIASSLGLSVLFVWAILSLTRRLAARWRVRAYVAVLVVVTLAAIPLNVRRNWEWRDPLRLWESTVRTSPRNARAWMNAGQLHMSRGNRVKAREYFVRAQKLAPSYAFVYMNLSALEAADGNRDASLAAAREAVRLRPDLALTHFYLGAALERTASRDEAAAAYGRSLELNPRDEQVRQALDRLGAGGGSEEGKLMGEGLYALYTSKDAPAAIVAFRRVLALNPDHYGATFQLARALDQAGERDKATPLWEKVVRMAAEYGDEATSRIASDRLRNPTAAGAQQAMTAGLEALYTKNDPVAAEAHFRRVLETNPSHYGATYQIAVALDRSGRRAEARGYWEKMLPMAEAAGDAETLKTARKRLEQPR